MNVKNQLFFNGNSCFSMFEQRNQIGTNGSDLLDCNRLDVNSWRVFFNVNKDEVQNRRKGRVILQRDCAVNMKRGCLPIVVAMSEGKG